MASARRLGRLTKGMGGTAIGAATGAGTYYLHKMLSQKVGVFQKYRYLGPAAFVVTGHLLNATAKRGGFVQSAGASLCGAGGYALGMAFDLRPQEQQQAAAAPVETQAFVPPSEVQALTPPEEVTAYYPPDMADEVGMAYDDVMSL